MTRERLRARLIRGGQAAVELLAARANYHVIRGMADRDARPDPHLPTQATPWSMTTDYVRNSTLELVCREIQELQVPGDIAELGVFRGDFSFLMSEHLPDRPVHLFDTFSGFDDADVAVDTREGLAQDIYDFSDTDPAVVRARFRHPDQVHLHVGHFPGTAASLESQRFALVSIDADLYAPVLSGLEWFYERLSTGGYLLVHDYNNAVFSGAHRAVREFQASTGAVVTPLPDWGGTAVIGRPRR